MTEGYRVRILEPAASELGRLDKTVARRVLERIGWLADNIEKTRSQTLKGDLTGLYKLRVGDYRVFYAVIKEERIIVIHLVGHRKDVYRKR